MPVSALTLCCCGLSHTMGSSVKSSFGRLSAVCGRQSHKWKQQRGVLSSRRVNKAVLVDNTNVWTSKRSHKGCYQG